MKIRFGIHAIALLLLWTGFSGCQNDSQCKDLSCVNGTCEERSGSCACDDFFEGTNCDVLETEKFIGTWQVGDICTTGSAIYTSAISKGPQQGTVVIANLFNESNPVTATIDGPDLDIADQAFGVWTISGTGGIDPDASTITIEYVVDQGGGSTITCQAALTLQ